ncbi:MAG TPA: choice-of-anchor B family protein [Actinomycetota bacterium]|nr:choice-of-anchor B family protein [Actinomycetota bacterium]
MRTSGGLKRIGFALVALTVLIAGTAFPAGAQAPGAAKCVNGKAAGFPCHKIDLLAHVTLDAVQGGGVSDVWGWVDPETKNEYAVLGGAGGVRFFDVTNPIEPLYLGRMVGKAEVTLPWVEMEILNDHLYVVCDLSPCGLQIFDLKRLVGVEAAAPVWRPDVVLPLGTLHTIASNPETNHIFLNGYGAVLGSPAGQPIIFDVSVPLAPVPVGIMTENGYAHDSLCVTYKGVDKKYKGNEICFNFNGGGGMNVYDVTADPVQPQLLASATYKGLSYSHSGALTKDQSYLISTDEADEQDNGTPSTLYIWDVRKLTKPKMIGTFVARSASIDHNIYSEGDALYHANYVNGFRILDLKDASKAKLKEVAWFDTVPTSDLAEFNGAWAAYPYLPSGNVLIGDMGGAFFVVRPHDDVYRSLGVRRGKGAHAHH